MIDASASEWAKVFAYNLSKEKELIPTGEGWKTSEEVAKQLGVGWSTAQRKLVMGVKRGAVERFNGREVSPRTGVACKQCWYRPIALKS